MDPQGVVRVGGVTGGGRRCCGSYGLFLEVPSKRIPDLQKNGVSRQERLSPVVPGELNCPVVVLITPVDQRDDEEGVNEGLRHD